MQLFWVLDKKEPAVSAGDPNRTAHNPMLHAILYDFCYRFAGVELLHYDTNTGTNNNDKNNSNNDKIKGNNDNNNNN